METRLQQIGDPVEFRPAVDLDDDAQAVIRYCGRPTSDTTLSSFSAVENGPIRRLYYRRKRPVTLEFIPAATPGQTGRWRFNDARVRGELGIITADRLDYFFPCAAFTLRPNY